MFAGLSVKAKPDNPEAKGAPTTPDASSDTAPQSSFSFMESNAGEVHAMDMHNEEISTGFSFLGGSGTAALGGDGEGTSSSFSFMGTPDVDAEDEMPRTNSPTEADGGFSSLETSSVKSTPRPTSTLTPLGTPGSGPKVVKKKRGSVKIGFARNDEEAAAVPLPPVPASSAAISELLPDPDPSFSLHDPTGGGPLPGSVEAAAVEQEAAAAEAAAAEAAEAAAAEAEEAAPAADACSSVEIGQAPGRGPEATLAARTGGGEVPPPETTAEQVAPDAGGDEVAHASGPAALLLPSDSPSDPVSNDDDPDTSGAPPSASLVASHEEEASGPSALRAEAGDGELSEGVAGNVEEPVSSLVGGAGDVSVESLVGEACPRVEHGLGEVERKDREEEEGGGGGGDAEATHSTSLDLKAALSLFLARTASSCALLGQLHEAHSSGHAEREALMSEHGRALQASAVLEAQQSSLAEAEDYDAADALHSKVLASEASVKDVESALARAGEEAKRLSSELEAGRRGQALEAKALVGELTSLSNQHGHSSASVQSASEAALALEAQRLGGEKERLEAESSHVAKDRGNLEEERLAMEEQISGQTKGVSEAKVELSLELYAVEELVTRLQAELERALGAKQEIKAKLAKSEEAVLTVRSKFSRQLQRISEREVIIVRSEQECVLEFESFSREVRAHQARRESGELEASQNESLRAELVAEVGAATALEEILHGLLLEASADSAPATTTTTAATGSGDGSGDNSGGGLLSGSGVELEGLRAVLVVAEAEALSASRDVLGLQQKLESMRVLAALCAEKLPQVEAAKKAAAALKNFKEAGVLAKEAKLLEQRQAEASSTLRASAPELAALEAAKLTAEGSRLDARADLANAQAGFDRARLLRLRRRAEGLNRHCLRLQKKASTSSKRKSADLGAANGDGSGAGGGGGGDDGSALTVNVSVAAGAALAVRCELNMCLREIHALTPLLKEPRNGESNEGEAEGAASGWVLPSDCSDDDDEEEEDGGGVGGAGVEFGGVVESDNGDGSGDGVKGREDRGGVEGEEVTGTEKRVGVDGGAGGEAESRLQNGDQGDGAGGNQSGSASEATAIESSPVAGVEASDDDEEEEGGRGGGGAEGGKAAEAKPVAEDLVSPLVPPATDILIVIAQLERLVEEAAENEDYEAAGEHQEEVDRKTNELGKYEATSESHKEAVAIAKSQELLKNGLP